MKYCTKCGTALADQAQFCSGCGSAAGSEQAEKMECMEDFRKFLKWERFSWRLFGIIFLVCSLIILTCALAIIIAGGMTGYSYRLDMAVVGIMYGLMGVLYLPIAIVNLVMAKKAGEYREDLEHDPKPVMERCGSVGLIVLAAFFNNLALVFIIINFVRTKTCKHIIDKL